MSRNLEESLVVLWDMDCLSVHIMMVVYMGHMGIYDDQRHSLAPSWPQIVIIVSIKHRNWGPILTHNHPAVAKHLVHSCFSNTQSIVGPPDKSVVHNPLSSPRCARSRGDTNRSEHHTAFSEMKKMTRECAVSCQVVVRQFTDWNIL